MILKRQRARVVVVGKEGKEGARAPPRSFAAGAHDDRARARAIIPTRAGNFPDRAAPPPCVNPAEERQGVDAALRDAGRRAARRCRRALYATKSERTATSVT